MARKNAKENEIKNFDGSVVKDHQCTYDDHGYRCQAFGHLAQSTNGSGPWYCREHFAMLMGWHQLAASAVDSSSRIDDLKRVLAKGKQNHVD